MSDRYHKIRTAHKVHILSWVLALERSGSVPCHFKNCKFMSITVEEIAHHYAYFQCENVPPFECKLCGQCSDNEAKILYHMIYTHSYTATPEELSIVNDFFNIPIKKEVTPVLRRAWYIFLENRGYLKCFQKMCLFVPESVEEMEEHYLHYCMETVWSDLKFSCRTCQGRFFSEEKLTSHVIDAHKSVEPLKPPVTKSRLSELELQKTWGDAIVVYKQAKCPVEQCKFVSNSVSVLEKHYKYCNGQKNFYVECPTCNYWLQSEGKLIEHRKCIHKDTETILVKQEQFELEPEPAEGDDVSIVISYEQNNDTVKIEQEAKNDCDILSQVEEQSILKRTKDCLNDKSNLVVKTEPLYFDESSVFIVTETHFTEEGEEDIKLNEENGFHRKSNLSESIPNPLTQNFSSNDKELAYAKDFVSPKSPMYSSTELNNKKNKNRLMEEDPLYITPNNKISYKEFSTDEIHESKRKFSDQTDVMSKRRERL